MFKKISLRLWVTLLLIAVQVALVASLVSLAILRFPAITYVGFGVSFVVFLYILRTDGESAYKITWIIVVLSLPLIGGILYWLCGKDHLIRRRIVAHVEEHALIAKLLDKDEVLLLENQVECERMYSLMRYVRQYSSYHPYENTPAKYYPFGELMFEDMLTALERAEKFIFLEFFIIEESGMWNNILEVLERKAAQGVEVRLIVDDFGSQRLFTSKYIKALRAKNILVLRFNPIVPLLLVFMNHRDHRKILVVDGKSAFVGGVNIADEYINKNDRLGVWKDTGLKLTGDGVWSFTLMFIEMWDTFCKACERIDDHSMYRQVFAEDFNADGFVLPYGDSPLDEQRLAENIYIDILAQARNYVYIFTPYLIISEKMIHALQMAARRGVDVRIIMPGIPDKKLIFRLSRSYYTCLLEAGVRIFEYTPGFLHAKTFVCDDETAVVGTINLDYRSLYLHFECATLLYGSDIVKSIKEDAIDTIAQCREVDIQSLKKPSSTGMLDAVLHLFSPLL